MTKIHLLSETLINQIAAGEVVERPASAIKELIENSIDAGATEIIVEIVKSGFEMMSVTDNGQGMNREDSILCFERHATSKIFSLEDLEKVSTLGFRGEALASIAAVSKVELTTRQPGENAGTRIINEGGIIKLVEDFGKFYGTTVRINDIFYNTPARKKFLKSEDTEYQNILEWVINAALIHTEISFRLIKDSKAVLELPATKDSTVRLRGIFGKGISDDMLPVFYESSILKIGGFIGKPSISRANRNMQYFFVNGRPIKSPTLAYAVKNAFSNLIPKERHPAFVINFLIDPTMVDVNVHPRKTEVKFADEKEIFGVLLAACKKALENSVLTPKFNQNLPQNYYSERKSGGIYEAKTTIQNSSSIDLKIPEPVLQFSLPINTQPENVQERTTSEIMGNEIIEITLELKVLYQFNNAFIVCQKGDSLVFVDQHAAHERIRFQKIIKEEADKKINIQPLLTPIVMDFSIADKNILQKNLEVFAGLGFEIAEFGGNSFSISAVPDLIVKANIEKITLGLIDDLRDEKTADLLKKKEQAFTYMACRSAVKFGDKLSMEEMQALVDELQKTELKDTCPHGRPSMVELGWSELLARFGRNYSGLSEGERPLC